MAGRNYLSSSATADCNISCGGCVYQHNGKLATNSLLVAQGFERKHSDVIRSITNIINSTQNCAQYFQESSYVDSTGRTLPMYIMDRDGFSLLVMGFTGKRAMQFKIDFINAFNQMEAQFKVAVPKQLSALDMLELSVKAARENQLQIEEVKQEVRELKAQTVTRPDYFTIAGYATLNGFKVNVTDASRYGRMAAKMCNEQGFPMDTIPDPRWGKVRMYPKQILQEVFDQPMV